MYLVLAAAQAFDERGTELRLEGGRMKWREALRRIKGIHATGLDVDLPEHEVTVARRVLSYLEDRRVLYEPYEQEDPEQCVASILSLREHLSQEIAGIQRNKSPLVENLSAMRSACREFLGEVDVAIQRDRDFLLPDSWGPRRWWFDAALGGLRRLMGVQIAAIAGRAKLDVPSVLEPILPPSPDD